MLCQVETDANRMLPEILAEVDRMIPEVEAEAARLLPGIEAQARTEVAKSCEEMMREAAFLAPEPLVDGDEEPAPEIVRRSDYVPKENEAPYLVRGADGLPELHFVDAGDRMVIWSPRNGGALINPKSPGLRRMGLYSSYPRGRSYYKSGYRAADLRKGKWADLERQPENPHDKNAVAMCAPGSSDTFGYVQKGRAPAVARRIDAGEDLAGISMRGSGSGREGESAFILIGSKADLTAMLDR